jgi:hypothetical protein
MAILALSVESVETGSIVAVVVVVLVALLALKLLASMVMKVISLVIFAALGIGIWSQRANMVDCADQVRAAVDAGIDPTAIRIQCGFFGYDVDVALPSTGSSS